MSSVDAALEALRQGKPIAILDSRDREGETDLFFPATVTHAPEIRFLRTQAGGELYIAIGHEVTRAFGLPYAGTALQEAAEKYPVVKGMAKHNTEMCQVGQLPDIVARRFCQPETMSPHTPACCCDTQAADWCI
eukprot:GHRR01036711.1.p2 GENE.GHRR01036711.1~~GHRR01036711.1.p2  ORF type:complete len:134 (+),score=30.00 GHRR01036711.1:306-707(+)